MITFRISTEVKEDRRVTLTMPAEVPTGKTEFLVTVAPQLSRIGQKTPTSPAEWAEADAEHWKQLLPGLCRQWYEQLIRKQKVGFRRLLWPHGSSMHTFHSILEMETEYRA